jgi:hypothetical protein
MTRLAYAGTVHPPTTIERYQRRFGRARALFLLVRAFFAEPGSGFCGGRFGTQDFRPFIVVWAPPPSHREPARRCCRRATTFALIGLWGVTPVVAFAQTGTPPPPTVPAAPPRRSKRPRLRRTRPRAARRARWRGEAR